MYYATLYGKSGIAGEGEERFHEVEMDVLDLVEIVDDMGWSIESKHGDWIVYRTPKVAGYVLVMYVEPNDDPGETE